MNTYAIEVDHKEKMMITAKNASNALTRYLKILEKTYSVSKRAFASASKEWGGRIIHPLICGLLILKINF